MYNASTAFVEALVECGVEYIFANFGSDHPALIEALASFKANGKASPIVITCPNEMVALSAAHGFAQVTGRPQAVVVHVDCGTQALAGAVHNVARCRVPVLVFAGAAPFTLEGELSGSRNEFIHWIQDVPDQRGIVRGYAKYDNEIRTGRNLKQIVSRALQIATSEPKGLAYLVGAREVMEEEFEPRSRLRMPWPSVSSPALNPADVVSIASALLSARRPLIVTSYLGRNECAVKELLRLSNTLGIGILESGPVYLNCPADHPLYLGNQFSEPEQNTDLAEADVVLVLDADVPWIPLHNKPKNDARIIHIDIDPLKAGLPLWYLGAELICAADTGIALAQVNAELTKQKCENELVAERRGHYQRRHLRLNENIRTKEQPNGEVITAEFLTACIRKCVGDDCIVLNEGITNYTIIHNHLRRSKFGSIYRSGGSSLGWNGGAAIGMKLAMPKKTIVALTGDGSYMFTVPSSVHWMAREYETPFLQIIYNNRGWRSPKLSTLSLYPQGAASTSKNIGVNLDPPADYAGIAAAAGGAFATTVKSPVDLEAALSTALDVVHNQKRCAVVDVWLPHL